jgi:hypothetical protein
MAFIGKSPSTGAYKILDSITTSATDTYALTDDSVAYFPASAKNLIVSLNGVTQAPEAAYIVGGSNIIFASALTSSDVIDYILVLGESKSIERTLNLLVPGRSVNTEVDILSGIITVVGRSANVSVGVT